MLARRYKVGMIARELIAAVMTVGVVAACCACSDAAAPSEPMTVRFAKPIDGMNRSVTGHDLATLVGARACRMWLVDARGLGPVTDYEVRLLVPADRIAQASRAIGTRVRFATITTGAPLSTSTPSTLPSQFVDAPNDSLSIPC